MESADSPVFPRAQTARKDFVQGARPAVSPEVSGTFECPVCGERERFVGTDIHGADGPDACNCDRPGGDHDLECGIYEDVELVQHFLVISQDGTSEGANIDYDSHEGGCSGAEIVSYTSIHCGNCESLVWEEGLPTSSPIPVRG